MDVEQALRAVRDLVILCESGTVWDAADMTILERGRNGYVALAARHGFDAREGALVRMGDHAPEQA